MDVTGLRGLILERRYRLRECRGTGSFATVYAAEELLRGKRVGRCCLKLMLPESGDRELMLREVGHLARLSHPRIVGFRGCGEVTGGPLEGSLFLAMELGERSLRSDLEHAALSPGELMEVVQGLAEALAFLHEQGLVHRDVKPDNLILCNGSWKLSDFGLTRTLSSLARLGPLPGGTPAYKAPEIFAGGRLGPAVDMWALGVIVQESLTGQLPYGEESPEDHPLWHEPVVEDLLEPFGWLVRGCLVVEPELRLTAPEVLETLSTYRSGRPLGERWLDECDRLVFRGSYGHALTRLRKLACLQGDLGRELAGRYDQLLHLAPFELRGQVYVDLGRLVFRQGYRDRAREVLEEGRRLFPETPGLLLALGEVYREILPENLEVLEMVARLYETAGQRRAAAEAYRTLVERTSGPARELHRKHLQRLERG